MSIRDSGKIEKEKEKFQGVLNHMDVSESEYILSKLEAVADEARGLRITLLAFS